MLEIELNPQPYVASFLPSPSLELDSFRDCIYAQLLQELTLSVHHVGSRDQTQGIKLSSKCPSIKLSHWCTMCSVPVEEKQSRLSWQLAREDKQNKEGPLCLLRARWTEKAFSMYHVVVISARSCSGVVCLRRYHSTTKIKEKGSRDTSKIGLRSFTSQKLRLRRSDTIRSLELALMNPLLYQILRGFE